MFVVETILSSQFAWVSVFSSSNLSLKHAYINFSKLSIKLFSRGHPQACGQVDQVRCEAGGLCRKIRQRISVSTLVKKVIIIPVI